jgi:5-formyltetrahydrofolate cyclo-ligase
MADQQALRRAIRARRRSIPAAIAGQYAQRLAKNARQYPYLLNSRRVAGFLPADGEMDPLPLMQYLWSLGKRIYLPVLVPFNSDQLWFAQFEPGDKLVYNRYGIPEPVSRDLIKATALDLVLTPLVAFDTSGHRIGMGGGFYDRSFAFLRRRVHWHKPRLLGIAYELQKQPAIRVECWDIPLDAIVTEATLYAAGG